MVKTIHMALVTSSFRSLRPRLRKWRTRGRMPTTYHPDIIFIMLKRNQQIFNQLPDGFFLLQVINWWWR